MKRFEQMRNPSNVDFFYHLSGNGINQCSCCGLACFVARHLNPVRGQLASSQTPEVYCLGKCYMAPAAGFDDQRPAMQVYAKQGIILNRLASGGCRRSSEYGRVGGYRAIE